MVELQLISNKSMGSKSGTPSKRKGHCFTRKCSSLVKEQRARIYVLVGVVCLICSVGSSANDGSPVLFVTSFLVNFCTCKAHICLACLAGLDTRGGVVCGMLNKHCCHTLKLQPFGQLVIPLDHRTSCFFVMIHALLALQCLYLIILVFANELKLKCHIPLI